MAEPAGQRWWSKDSVAVITGGNRGIGLAIAHQLGAQGFIVVLADIVTDEELKQTAEGLEEELGSALQSPRVYCHHLDIRDNDSVQQFAAWVKEKFGHISVLVNSAGIATRAKDFRYADLILETNFWGTKRITNALLPLLASSEDGRIVFMTSRLGIFSRLDDGYAKRKLKDVEHLTEDDLDELGRRYLDDIRADKVEQEGWIKLGGIYTPAYSESKMLVTAYTVLLARSLRSEGKSVSVNAVCPGPTRTPMIYDDIVERLLNRGWHIKSTSEGADTPVWLILLPKDGCPTGRLFADRQEFSYDVEIPEF